MSNDNQTTLTQNTPDNQKSTTTLSQLNAITEAFTGDDFTKITSEEFTNNPLAGKMMAMLYAENDKKLKEADRTIIELTKQVGYYQSFPTANVGYAIMNVIGTIVVGLGVSMNNNIWLIVLGGLLVIAGNIIPLLLRKNKI